MTPYLTPKPHSLQSPSNLRKLSADEADEEMKKVSRSLSPAPTARLSLATEVEELLPAGLISSFTVLSSSPLPPHQPPDKPTWVPSPEQVIVSSYPEGAGIEKLEWFLPSNMILLSPDPPR